jgi:hypothetical protein
MLKIVTAANSTGGKSRSILQNRGLMPHPTAVRLLPALLAVTALAGCGSTDPSDLGAPALLVKTDKLVYSLSVDVEAHVTLINHGSVRIYAPMNEYVYVEQWSDNGWINRSPWFVVDGIGPSFPVAPGDSLTSPPMSFAYVNRRAGTYRFVFEVALDRLGRHLVPEEQRVSEPFMVTW